MFIRAVQPTALGTGRATELRGGWQLFDLEGVFICRVMDGNLDFFGQLGVACPLDIGDGGMNKEVPLLYFKSPQFGSLTLMMPTRVFYIDFSMGKPNPGVLKG